MDFNFNDVENILYQELFLFILAQLEHEIKDPELDPKLREWDETKFKKLQNAFSKFEVTRGFEEFLDEIDQNYDEFEIDLADYLEEFRCSGNSLEIEPREFSRCYEAKEVGRPLTNYPHKLLCWTYWFGGGKHGEPQGIPWIEKAYIREMSEGITLASVNAKLEEITNIKRMLEELTHIVKEMSKI